MSIVTDALNRLQSARARSGQALSAHDADPSKADTSDVQDDEKTSVVDSTFVSVSIGGFLLALVVAMGAYWWGEHPVADPSSIASSTPVRADRSIALSRDEPLEPISSDPDLTGSAELPDELSPGELPPLSPSYDTEEPVAATEPLDEEAHEVTVSLALESMAETVPDSERRMHDVAGLSVETASVSTEEDRVPEFQAVSLNGTGETEDHGIHDVSAGREGHVMVSDDAQHNSISESEKSDRTFSSQELPKAATEFMEQHVDETDMPRVSTADAISPLPPQDTDSQHLVQHVESPHEPMSSETKGSSIAEVSSSLSPQQRLLKARLLIQQQSHAEAIDVLQPLFVAPPATWEPWFWMGTAQFGLGELEKAEDAFMEGLVRDETVPYLWVQRAVIEQQRGHYGKAMDALRQAELLDAKLPEVQLNLAYNLEQQGQANLARRHYRQYLSLTEGRLAYHGVRRKVLEHMLRTQPSPHH
ncbi:MAG: hypothetical protein NPIRA02_18900 [Nitrospirales bacterium]|nr:MAG: hypothetical protein NPIRA02_18900 [Nitrospirales bacterium]